MADYFPRDLKTANSAIFKNNNKLNNLSLIFLVYFAQKFCFINFYYKNFKFY